MLNRLILFVLAIVLFSCSPVSGPDKTAAGAILGSGWGAGAGAVIGNQTGNPAAGAAIGVGMMAASGIIAGVGLDVEEGSQLETRRQLDRAEQLTAYNRARLGALIEDSNYGHTVAAPYVQIFFDKKRASLKQASVAQIAHVAESLRGRRFGSYEITLKGYSTDISEQLLNKELINARLASVKSSLVSNGIPDSSINASTYELKKEDTFSQGVLLKDRSEPLNRYNNRVEIFITYN